MKVELTDKAKAFLNDLQVTARVRALNDFMRHNPVAPGKWVMTAGINALPAETIGVILRTAQLFKNFHEGNDPWQEHDFARFEVGEHKCYFKIDYYDLKCEFGSEDPSNPEITTRVLTVGLQSEY